jgi:hypothetical protein
VKCYDEIAIEGLAAGLAHLDIKDTLVEQGLEPVVV